MVPILLSVDADPRRLLSTTDRDRKRGLLLSSHEADLQDRNGGAKEPYGKAAVVLIHWAGNQTAGRQPILANLSVENRPSVDNIDDIFVDISLLTYCFICMR